MSRKLWWNLNVEFFTSVLDAVELFEFTEIFFISFPEAAIYDDLWTLNADISNRNCDMLWLVNSLEVSSQRISMSLQWMKNRLERRGRNQRRGDSLFKGDVATLQASFCCYFRNSYL